MPTKQRPTNQTSSSLAEPFSRLFVDRAEADWVFDLFRDTVRQLRATAYDPRLAVTLSERSGKLHLHVNFGSWLVIGFRGPGQVPERVDVTLLAQTIAWDERLTGFAFERKEGEPEVRSYALPLDVVRPLTTSLRQAYETSLDFIANKFQNWKKATHWKQHNPELIEAFFDPERRERLFAAGLTDFELVYERQYTAFSSDLVLAEEGVGYEAEAKAEITNHKNTNANEGNLLEREKINKKLSEDFERFKHNFYDRCIVKLRRKRIGQLRDLLSNPGSITAQIFNQEVWNIHNTVTFNGAVVNIFERDDFDDEVLSQIDTAIDSDDFEVGGNSIWGSGSRVYAPRLINEDEKTNYIHQALHILNDTKLTPLEKVERIKSIYGFGDNISTGLVMIFHPDEFSLYNREAQNILGRLGYGSRVSLKEYQEIIRELKNDLEAQDYLELDWFLYRVNRRAYSSSLNEPDEYVTNDSELLELAEPFSQIFASFEEAEWAFDLLTETCERLGIEDAADERFAVTLVERYGGLSLHFNFYDWLILGFRPPELAQKRVRLPLLIESAPFGKSFIEYEFEQAVDEAPIAAYGLPIEKVRGWETDLQSLFKETLTAIAQRFSTRPYSRDETHHQPALATAIFDKNARLPLLTEPTPSLSDPPQLPITN
ncbi:MAG: hypothetical protein KDJ52_24765, partial [Anaerolineae bacterium]|nr:hypothetical protein [Anaerolineae bacterium]